MVRHLRSLKQRYYSLFAASLGVWLLTLFSISSTVSAAGGAYFGLSPASGSYTTGSTLTVNVTETSSSGDNVNAVQANLSYPSSLLAYRATTLTGPFSLCTQNSGGSGVVYLGCASTSTVSGTQAIAQITFSVLATGQATVGIISGSDIVSNSGTSVWDGVLTHAQFTLAAPAPPPSSPAPSKPAPVRTKPVPTIASTTPAATTATQTASTPTSGSPIPTTANPTPTASTARVVTVSVIDSHGKPVSHATVSVDGHYTTHTDVKGKADFTGISSGTHHVTVTASGKQTAQVKLVLGTEQAKLVSVKLANRRNSGLLIVGVAISATALVVGGYLMVRPKRPNILSPGSSGPAPLVGEEDKPVVGQLPEIGGGGQTIAPQTLPSSNDKAPLP